MSSTAATRVLSSANKPIAMLAVTNASHPNT
jgi:hypothetical protein